MTFALKAFFFFRESSFSSTTEHDDDQHELSAIPNMGENVSESSSDLDEFANIHSSTPKKNRQPAKKKLQVGLGVVNPPEKDKDGQAALKRPGKAND